MITMVPILEDNGLVGYEFANGFFTTLDYYYGFQSSVCWRRSQDKLYHRYFSLKLGYFLPVFEEKITGFCIMKVFETGRYRPVLCAA